MQIIISKHHVITKAVKRQQFANQFFIDKAVQIFKQFKIFCDLKVEGRASKASLIFCFTPLSHFNRNPLLLVELVKSSRGHKKATIMRSCRHPKRHFDSVADNQFQTPLQGRRKPILFIKSYSTKCKELKIFKFVNTAK